MDARPATTRLFLALWPDAAVREQLRTWRDLWTWPRGASPVATDKLHLTLHFLGSQPSERLPEFIDGFGVAFSPFELVLGVPTVWPGGIAVLEPGAAPPELVLLHANIRKALLAAGLAPEARKYRAHVTMARQAAGAAPPQHGPVIGWQVDGYALVESRGGRYEVLARYG